MLSCAAIEPTLHIHRRDERKKEFVDIFCHCGNVNSQAKRSNRFQENDRTYQLYRLQPVHLHSYNGRFRPDACCLLQPLPQLIEGYIVST